MTIKSIKRISKQYVKSELGMKIEVERGMFIAEKEGMKIYNKKIGTKFKDKDGYGVYLWINDKTEKIIYIGKAGEIRKNNDNKSYSYSKQTLKERLLAPRKDKDSKKYFQTNRYIMQMMNKYKIEKIIIYVMYSKDSDPPSFLEALLLYHYYKKTNQLPLLNKSF